MGRKRKDEEDAVIAHEIEVQAAKDRTWKKLREKHPELPEDYDADRKWKGK